MKQLILIIAITFIPYAKVAGNNIQVSNVTLGEQDEANKSVIIKFDLSWENSWRVSTGPSNWDAAWVFVKYRANNGNWEHATLNYEGGSPDGEALAQPEDCVVEVQGDEVGAFIYRANNGNGHVNYEGVQLRWNFSGDGVKETDFVDVQVFAIEMVYVPEGSYYLGGTGTEPNRFYQYPDPANAIFLRNPFLVTGEVPPISIEPVVGSLYYDEFGDQTGTLDSSWPKGYAAFYCMKYEVSQGQWVAFFNTLTDVQKEYVDLGFNPIGNTTTWSGTGNMTTQTQDRPFRGAKPRQVSAYLDWAGLRPMTELEFEKACRGPNYPVPNEYAWGTPHLQVSDYQLANEGQSNEVVLNMGEFIGHALVSQTIDSDLSTRAFRCGIFAASAINHTREETGSSYYGIMELSGNLVEIVISPGTPEGRAFTNIPGDGNIGEDGTSTPWNIQEGGTLRGGSATRPSVGAEIARRSPVGNVIISLSGGLGDGCIRGVRTAESE